MSAWLGAIALVAAGLAWLESRRPNRANLASRVASVLVAVAALVVLLNTRGSSGRVTLLTPGAPLVAHSRDGVPLDRAQSLASLATRQPLIHLTGWGLLAHEWPARAPELAGFDPAPLPAGITQLDAPTEVGVGERMIVRGTATLAGDSGWVILDDPAGARDSAPVSRESGGFAVSDRPRASGAVAYRLRLRAAGTAEIAETVGVAIRDVPMPEVLILEGSPSFETGYLKRWLGGRGARVTVRTAISRGKYRTERINQSGGDIGTLSAALLSRYQAVLADGGSIAALSGDEQRLLERQVRERGLGLVVTADAPWLLAGGQSGLLNGFGLEATTSGSAALSGGDRSDRRVARPVLRNAPRRSRTGIEAEAATIRPAGIEPIARDETGRMAAGWKRAGTGRIALTLLRAPSRWILEGEPDLFAAYWHAMLQAVARDTTARVFLGADGPLRANHPVRLTLQTGHSPGTRGSELGSPLAAVVSPLGQVDTIPLAQDPFDPTCWTGRYWPRQPGWHRLELAGERRIPFRVSHASEWIGLEASARLAATAPRVARVGQTAPPELMRAWLAPLAFTGLLLALSWLWIEGRLQGGEQ